MGPNGENLALNSAKGMMKVIKDHSEWLQSADNIGLAVEDMSDAQLESYCADNAAHTNVDGYPLEWWEWLAGNLGERWTVDDGAVLIEASFLITAGGPDTWLTVTAHGEAWIKVSWGGNTETEYASEDVAAELWEGVEELYGIKGF